MTAALLLAAAAALAAAPAPKEVSFKTGDGWTLAALYRELEGKGFVQNAAAAFHARKLKRPLDL